MVMPINISSNVDMSMLYLQKFPRGRHTAVRARRLEKKTVEVLADAGDV